MRRCECGGLVPPGAVSCPNCDLAMKSGQRGRQAFAIVALAVSSSCSPVAIYGLPPCADGGNACHQEQVDAGAPDGGSADSGK